MSTINNCFSHVATTQSCDASAYDLDSDLEYLEAIEGYAPLTIPQSCDAKQIASAYGQHLQNSEAIKGEVSNLTTLAEDAETSTIDKSLINGMKDSVLNSLLQENDALKKKFLDCKMPIGDTILY